MTTRTNRRFLAPEVIQTSGMDCGPASLKCLLEGYRIPVSYDRLREACQTDVDGASIDTIEEIAVQLGLDAEQIILPRDYLFITEAQNLPCLIVVKLPNGNIHFVILWAKYGPIIQIMDPASGRRWLTVRQFLDEIFIHQIAVTESEWRDWAASDEFLNIFRIRLHELGLNSSAIHGLIQTALGDPGWRMMATLDASARMVALLIEAHSLKHGPESSRMLQELLAESLKQGTEEEPLIPTPYWMVRPAPINAEGNPQLIMRGAVLVRVKGLRAKPASEESASQPLAPELKAALQEPLNWPFRTLLTLLGKDGWLAPVTLLTMAVVAAAGRTFEALLIRGMLGIGPVLGLVDQRLNLAIALLGFLIVLILLEAPLVDGLLRLGRRLEVRLRIAFLQKIPRLGDAYFRSRLTSDMAERSHSIYQIRELPTLGGRVVQLSFELLFTTLALIWLYPRGAPIIILASLAWVAIPFMMRPLVGEADLRARSITGALSRFYLDGLLGLTPIHTHGASRSIRREHESLLKQWVRAQIHLLKTSIPIATGIQYLIGFPLLIWIVLGYVTSGGQSEVLILLVYWALNIQTVGENLMSTALRYPVYRNRTLRLLEPLGAVEENHPEVPLPPETTDSPVLGVTIHLRGATVRAAGHTILEDIDLNIQPGEHVAIVGPSGAGKTTLVSLLLGWHSPTAGEVCVDGQPLDAKRLLWLRQKTAWVDPAVQLWNRSVLKNLRYGFPDDTELPIGQIIEQADLLDVLGKLTRKYSAGLQTPLGESGGLISGGEGQRVRLARAMLRSDVRLVILDEPFRGLNRAERHELLTRTRRLWQRATLLCITHDVKETQSFDRVLIVEGGRIIENNTPEALVQQTQSRYRALLDAEESVRVGLWSSARWRRLWIERGQISERDKKHG